MTTIIARIKNNMLGYLALLLIGGVIVGTHLLSLCVFFLFIHVFSDVFTNGIHRRFPSIPKAALLWLFYIIIIAFFVAVSIRFVPLFFADFSGYYEVLVRDATEIVNAISSRYDIHIDLPAFKAQLLAEGTQSIGRIFQTAKGFSKGIVYFIFTLVLNLLLFYESKRIKNIVARHRGSLLAYLHTFVVWRINRFYVYFRKVMGGQVIISLINTAISTGVIFSLDLPHKISLIFIVFICGLIPILGNLVSNTILSLTAFVSMGLFACIVCLALLVVIHKLEYFLNSKIIGTLMHLPMFITLLALLLGEAMLGVWGMMLAIPFILTLKDELEQLSA
jgi:predicted PurR-regulated permease PerM